MGVIKGDLLSESDKLADVSLMAAGHYSTFLSNAEITDDFGRVRIHGPLLVAKAFAKRLEKGKTDVYSKLMLRWFAEYEKAGLLRGFEHDGSRWGEWTNWQGKPASKRRMHRTPEPPWSDHVHSTTCGISGKRFKKKSTNRFQGGSTLAPSPLSPCSPFAPFAPFSPDGVGERSGVSVETERTHATPPPAAEPEQLNNGDGTDTTTTTDTDLRTAIDHDPNHELQAAIVDRCVHLAKREAWLQDKQPTPADVLAILHTVSTTPGGVHLEGLRHASQSWLDQTLRASEVFERENFDAERGPPDGST